MSAEEVSESQWSEREYGDDVPELSQVLHLRPGESRGWWRTHPGTDTKPTIALVHGAICDRRLPILLDSGASTSILSLSLARELGLKLDQSGGLAVKGLGGVTAEIRARTRVKITLGHRLVYHVDVWVGNIGGEVDCLLGMDFMRAAGVRLNVQEGKVSLPEEEFVPLMQPGGGTQRKPYERKIDVHKRIQLPYKESWIVPIDYRGVNPNAVELWCCRAKGWLVTVAEYQRAVPIKVRITAIWPHGTTLFEGTTLAVLAEKGHIPRGLRAVRPGSPRYEEWETLVYESSWSRKFRRGQEAANELERQALEREYQGSKPAALLTPRAILSRPRPTEILSTRVEQDDPTQASRRT